MSLGLLNRSMYIRVQAAGWDHWFERRLGHGIHDDEVALVFEAGKRGVGFVLSLH